MKKIFFYSQALNLFFIGGFIVLFYLKESISRFYIMIFLAILFIFNFINFILQKKCLNNILKLRDEELEKSNCLRRLNDQEEKIYSKIELIVDALENIYKLNKKDFLKRVFDSAFELIPEAEKGSFYELDGDKYIPILCKGYDFDLLRKLCFDKDEIFLGFECSKKHDIKACEIYITKRDDAKFSKEIVEVFKKLGTYSNFTSLYAPIQVEGKNVGMICLENFNKIGFTKISKKLLKYYAQIISEFYSQRVYQENEKRIYNELVTALVSAIEVKDVYTEGHGQRVRKYSCNIAEKMNLSKEQIDNISIAALLHDIGKIGISTEILNKPGSLTEEEYEIIKKHPEYSKKILEKINDFSQIMQLAYLHHENFDGSGYPLGLKGDEIPIGAQIIHLADAYDAMTSQRAYRKAMSKQEAIEIIKREIGRQFHPEVARIALEEVFI